MFVTLSTSVLLFIGAERFRHRAAMLLGAVVLFLFSFSKLFGAIAVLPLLAGWAAISPRDIRRRRVFLALGVLAAQASWAIPRLAGVSKAIEAVAYRSGDLIVAGPMRFAGVMAFEFLGLPMIVAFLVILAGQMKRRILSRIDAFLFIAVVVPIAFVAAFKNQRPWFFYPPICICPGGSFSP
ncbi:MAG: hypothetical protein M5R36_19610 [Deltaproteobacteria bacterium]|nr:hypothetical protein [Deltaproteobacteria bacterium]